MLFRPTTVRDDRGKRMPFTLGGTQSKRRLQEHENRTAKERAEFVRKAATEKEANLPRATRWWRRVRAWPMYVVLGAGGIGAILGLIAGVVLAASVPLIVVALLLKWDWVTGVGATVGIGIVALIVLAARQEDQTRHRTAKRLAEIDICGACGYSLVGLDAAGDGRTECPECGAAWERSAKQAVHCPECGDDLDHLIVTGPRLAACPSCKHEFTFTPKPDVDAPGAAVM